MLINKLVFILVIIFVIGLGNSFSQNLDQDLRLIKNKVSVFKVKDTLNTLTEINYKRSTINPLKYVFRGSMSFYQYVISPNLYSDCAYQMSCSNYAKQSIHTRGIFTGILMASDRLMRCNSLAVSEKQLFLFNSKGKVSDLPIMYCR